MTFKKSSTNPSQVIKSLTTLQNLFEENRRLRKECEALKKEFEEAFSTENNASPTAPHN